MSIRIRHTGSGIRCAIPFEITGTGDLFFTRFEPEEEAVGVVLADMGKTALQGLEPDRILVAVFTLWSFRHDQIVQISGLYTFLSCGLCW